MNDKTLFEKLGPDEWVNYIMSKCHSRDTHFKKWLKEKSSLLGQSFFSPFLYKRAYSIQKKINTDDRDHFFVVCGKEGSGKSTMAIQLAVMIDPDFKLDRICFKMQHFIQGIRKSKPGQAFVLDEGNLFLFSREAMSSDNRFMLKLFALMRQRNLCVIICVPNFFTLDSYIRDHRVDTLSYVHKKGHFITYTDYAIKVISRDGKATKQVGGHKIPDGTYFHGTFNRHLPELNDITVKDYKNYKSEHFNQFLDELEQAVEAKEKKGNTYVRPKEAADILGVRSDRVISLAKEGKIKAKKLGGRYFILRKSLEDGFLGTSEGPTNNDNPPRL